MRNNSKKLTSMKASANLTGKDFDGLSQGSRFESCLHQLLFTKKETNKYDHPNHGPFHIDWHKTNRMYYESV